MKRLLLLVALFMSSSVMAGWTLSPGMASVPMGEYSESWAYWYEDVYGSSAVDTAIAADGSIYIVGVRQRALDAEIVTVKLNSDGIIDWSSVYNSPSTGVSDEASKVLVSDSGDIYVMGYTGGGVDQDVVILKYDASGTLLWTQLLNGVTGVAVEDKAIDMVLDNAGNPHVLMASYPQGANNIENIFVARLMPDGGSTVVVESMYLGDDMVYERPVAMEVDADGKVFVVATRLVGNAEDILVLKLNMAVSSIEWSHLFATVARDRAVDIGLDSLGNVYVSGLTWRIGLPAFVTFSLTNAANGNTGDNLGLSLSPLGQTDVRWLKQNNLGLNVAFTVPYTMLVAPGGDVYVAGKKKVITTAVDPVTGENVDVQEEEDLIIVKYDGTLTGAIQWSQQYNTGVQERVVSLALDASGMLFAAIETDDAVGLVSLANDGSLKSYVHSAAGYDEHPSALALTEKMLPDGSMETVAYISAGGFPGKLIEGDLTLFKYTVGRADLQLDSAQTDIPVLAVSEGQFVFTDTIDNVKDYVTGRLGDASAPFMMTYDLVGQSGTVTEGEIYRLGTRSIDSLLSGMSNTVESSFLVPPATTLPAGNYSFILSIDDAGVIIEYSKQDNVVNMGMLEVVDPPELVASSVTPVGSGDVLAEGILTANFQIDNTRKNPAAEFDVKFFLTPTDTLGNSVLGINDSYDPAIDIPLDVIVAGDSSATLGVPGVPGKNITTGANGIYTSTVELKIPNNIAAPDAYTLGMYVDSGDVILEPDNVYNVLRDASATVSVGSIVDLTVAKVTSQYGALAGEENVAVRYTIRSSNGGDASGFSNTAYLSRDEMKSADDMVIGVDGASFSAGMLAATLSGESVINATIPLLESDGVTAVNGLYYILVEVNSARTANENNYNNNIGYYSRKIVIGDGTLPDLVVSSVTTNVATASPDAAISVTGWVENVMPVDVVTPVSVSAYLSVDNQITADDYLIGSTTIPGVTANGLTSYVIDGIVPSANRVPATWIDLYSASVSGTVLATGGNIASARSLERITANGYAEYRVNQTSLTYYFGLGVDDGATSYVGYRKIDYGVKLFSANNKIGVYENGTYKFLYYHNLVVGDLIRVSRVSGTVSYSINGVTFYTSSTPSPETDFLQANVSYQESGAPVSDAYIANVVVMPGQSFYLGAIVDEQGTVGAVAEVSENNNAWYMEEVTETGGSLFPISVTRTRPSSGSGSVGLSLMILLMTGLLLRRRVAVRAIVSQYSTFLNLKSRTLH